MSTYVFTCRGRDYEVFHQEARKVREDFDELMRSDDPLLFDATINKYEKIIEDMFIPDAYLSKPIFITFRPFQALFQSGRKIASLSK